MPQMIESTTDTPEQIRAALGGADPGKAAAGETNPEASAADAGGQAETSTASEAAKNEQEDPAKAKAKEEGPGDEEDEDDELGEGHDKPNARKNGFKKRINKLNERARQAEERAIRAEERARYLEEESRKGKSGQSDKPDPKKTENSGRPRPEDFEDRNDYEDALVDWKLEQRESAAKAKSEQDDGRKVFNEKLSKFNEGVQALAKKIEDFEETLESNEVDISPTLRMLLLDSENGPELAYHLAKNQDEMTRICKMSPTEAARALGKFEAKHLSSPAQESGETNKETKRTTKAPPPTTPLKGKSTATPGAYRDDFTLAEYEKWLEETSR